MNLAQLKNFFLIISLVVTSFSNIALSQTNNQENNQEKAQQNSLDNDVKLYYKCMTCPEYHHFNPYYFGEEWEDELRRRDFDFHVFDVKKQEWVAFDVDVDELIDNINNHNNNYDFSNNSKNILNDKTVFAIEGGDALKGLGSIINTDKHVKKYQSQLLQGIIADGSADFSRGKYISVLAKAKITALKTTREHLLGVSDFKDLEQARSLTSKYVSKDSSILEAIQNAPTMMGATFNMHSYKVFEDTIEVLDIEGNQNMEDLYRAKSIKTSLLVEFVVGYTLSGNRFIEVNSLSINSEEADVLTDKNGNVLGEIQTSIQITPMNINPVAPPADDDKDFEITPELLKRLGIEAESADADYDLNK